MMIPESACPSLSDDGGVGVNSEFVRASPRLVSRGLPLDSGYGGAGASFSGAREIGSGRAFRTTKPLLRESSRSEGSHQGASEGLPPSTPEGLTHGSPEGLLPGPREGLLQGFPVDVLRKTRGDCSGCRPTRSTVMPDKYDGSGSWVDFITQFETIAELNLWDECEMAKFLAVSLRGSAREIYTDLPLECRRDIHQLTRALAKRFGLEDRSELHLAELRARTRRKGETLRELCQAVRRLVGLAYPDLPLSTRERLACNHFMDTLEDTEMRYQLFQARPRSLDEALARALEVEAFRRMETVRGGCPHAAMFEE